MGDKPASAQVSKATRFGQSWRDLLRITTVRVIVQTVFFLLFVLFVLLTTFAHLDQYPGLRYWLSKFLEIDPLIALSTVVTTHTLYSGLAWSLVVLVPTVFLGRIFCGWICPYGALHQFVGWLLGARRSVSGKSPSHPNRYRSAQRTKYGILIAMLVAAAFGMLQIGLLDPICLLYRSCAGAVVPAVQMPAPELFGDYRLHQGAWLIGFVLFGLVAANLIYPRFFCRVLCPLGALMGLLARLGWWRIERNEQRCIDCGQCRRNCEGACDPDTRLRRAECFVCFNCIEDCPTAALSFAWMPRPETEVPGPDTSRRHVVFAGAAGLLFYPFVRSTGRVTRDFSSDCIRPPGAVEELAFLKRCLKCDQCVRVCPTNTIQPALFEAGLEGLWTPVLNHQIGCCELNCTACGYVCPTGAIQRITLDEKHGRGAFAEAGPIKLGTAHFEPGRCLPYSKNTPCLVCQEVCPTSPKAIYTVRERRSVRGGELMADSATHRTLTLAPMAGGHGEGVGGLNGLQSDGTRHYFVLVKHADGQYETQPITSVNDGVVTIQGRFARQPQQHTPVVLQIELGIPRVDISRCIGCGRCVHDCPIVGDRRGIYVTAEDESRSRGYGTSDRDRSVKLL